MTDARALKVVPATDDVDHWRKLAVDAGDRLQKVEGQLKDLRKATDEARERMTKYKGRLDAANDQLNELQTKLIAVSAERDQLRERVARQEIIKRKVHDFRQSILDGPIWELFAEL